MKFSFVPATLWFGTDESYNVYLEALEQIARLETAGPEAIKAAIQLRGGGFGGDPFGLPPMWEMSGSTAVIHVQGSMIPGSAGFMRLFGAIGYEDIKMAMMDAMSQKEKPKGILLNIDSGGGAVNGVEDMGRFIRTVAGEMPVVSYTGGTMASAALWTGASANQVYAAQTAIVGSVGTMIVAIERSKQLADAGIGVKVIRSGKFKALNNPYEPLSKDGEAQLQALADSSGEVFVNYMADRRGTTPEKFQKTMGEGRVFAGPAAKDVGLIDGVMTFDDVLAHMKTLDKRSSTAQNSRHSAQGPEMKIRAISKAVILALAAGTKVEALGLNTPASNVEGTAPEAEDLTELTAQATEVAGAFETAKTAAVTAATTALKAESDKVVSGLTAKVTLLEAGAADLTGKVSAANELAASYAGIVKASIAAMVVPLGIADTSASLTGKELLAEHERVQALFTAKFPGGRVSAAGGVAKPEAGKGAGPSPEFLAATAAWAK